MLWEKIKKIVDTVGGKFVIVEDGKPRYVITGFDEFERLVSCARRGPNASVSSSQPPTEGDGSSPSFEARTADASSFESSRGREGARKRTGDLVEEEEEAATIRLDELPL